MARCSACKGQKRYMGLGGIERDCTACNGAGLIRDNIEIIHASTEVKEHKVAIVDQVELPRVARKVFKRVKK